MENSERQTFEQHWQRAFEGAEAIPSEGIWLSIDSTLTKVENDRNKRNVVYYQRLAASLVLICTASFLITLWQWKSSSSSNETSEVQEHTGKNLESTISTNSPSTNMKGKLPPEASVSKGLTRKNGGGRALQEISHGIPPVVFVNSDSLAAGESSLTLDTSHELVPVIDTTAQIAKTSLLSEKAKGLTEEEEKELAKKLLAQIETIVPEKKESHHDVWASLGFAGGTYSPGTSSIASPSSADYAKQSSSGASLAPVNGRSSLGTSYSIGLMFGKQLSKRWLVQTGFTYLNQRLHYESNIVASSPQGLTTFTPDFAIASGPLSYTITKQYAISRSTEFLSLPVQLGFVLVDRKVGVTMNAGVATDLFLRNTLTDKSGQYRNVSQSTGEDAVFRTLSWSGLASTEISFRLAVHYRLALVPGFRYSFTNTLKDESGFSQPLVLDVGFRFRYIFK